MLCTGVRDEDLAPRVGLDAPRLDGAVDHNLARPRDDGPRSAGAAAADVPLADAVEHLERLLLQVVDRPDKLQPLDGLVRGTARQGRIIE